jgi:Uncharacterised nucleotidyltransferase
MTRMVDQMAEALAAFSACETQPALIGGLALAAHNYVRATQDIDFLADAADADRLHEALLSLGYQCLHRSDDAANYVRGDEGLDFLYAHRDVSRKLLATASERETAFGRIRVVSAEGLIGFKLQAFVNNPKRTRDVDDVRFLLRNNRGKLNMDEVRQYFVLFERQDLLDELLAEDHK